MGGDTVKTESRGARRHGLHPHFFSFSHPPTPAKQKKEEEEEDDDDDDDDDDAVSDNTRVYRCSR